MNIRQHVQEVNYKLESVAKPSLMNALRRFTDAELLWHHANISKR